MYTCFVASCGIFPLRQCLIYIFGQLAGQDMKIINILTFSLCVMLGNVSVLHAANNLKGHPSPYLAMHGEDPVDWQRWDNRLFARAKKENKLVFVSIGYFACHWCHVMQRESYQNKEIASIINRDFIPVKVDRELRPALDARLISFVERTRGYAGWPLNVFITPDGYPLLGIVYLPPADFKSLLENMSSTWQTDTDGMNVMARAAADELGKTEPSLGPELDKKQVAYYQQLFRQQAMLNADHLQGGFGEQSKFPLVPQLSLLLKLYEQGKDQDLGTFLKLTLDKMATQGLYDHLRGGFYRYVVDPNWRIPHFEKMLYDNAQLVRLYLRAAKLFDSKDYVNVAMESMQFMQTELTTGTGAMISSLSAIDSNNIEGGYYLWSDDELKQLLTKQEYRIIKSYWGMKYAPDLEDGHHPRLDQPASDIAAELDISSRAVSKSITRIKAKLKKRQQQRSLPRDEKVLASWNGLALSALAEVSSQDKKYAEMGKATQSLILTRFWDGKALKRAIVKGEYLGNATLEDYAYVADGLWNWMEYTKDRALLAKIQAIVMQAWQRFYADDGWLLAEGMLPGISAREGVVADGPMPSPSAVLTHVTLKLARRLNDKKLLSVAMSALNRGHAILKTDNFWYAAHIEAMMDASR